jgi:hypothetical protein
MSTGTMFTLPLIAGITLIRSYRWLSFKRKMSCRILMRVQSPLKRLLVCLVMLLLLLMMTSQVGYIIPREKCAGLTPAKLHMCAVLRTVGRLTQPLNISIQGRM